MDTGYRANVSSSAAFVAKPRNVRVSYAPTLATTAAIDGVPFKLPGLGCVTSAPISIVFFCLSHVVPAPVRTWLTPPIFMLTLSATFAKYCACRIQQRQSVSSHREPKLSVPDSSGTSARSRRHSSRPTRRPRVPLSISISSERSWSYIER